MLDQLLNDLSPYQARLVAVSKTKPVTQIQEIYDRGQRIFGENRVQELTEKYSQLPTDIQWHLIGHLQSNKVKYIAPFVAMIHSVDSPKLLKEINKEGKKNDRRIPVLLQFKIAEEDTKFGMELKEVVDLLNAPNYSELKNVQIAGVMGMATFTDDIQQVRREFATLKNIFDQLISDLDIF